MIKIGDQLFVNSKWYFDVIGIYGEDLLIQVFYMFGYPKSQITRKTFKINKNLIFIEKENDIFKFVSVSEPKLKLIIGNLINQLLIQTELDFESNSESNINEDGGVAIASVGTTAGMGAVVSPGSPTTPGVSGTAGSDTAITTNVSSNGFDFDKKKKKKKTNEEFDFVKYNNSQKDKEIIDTRFSRKHIKQLIAMGKVLNPKIQSTELNKIIPNSWRPVDVINYNENNNTVEKMTEDDYKTNLLEFINRQKDDAIDYEISAELVANKESFIKNPIVKIKDYLNRFYNANIDLFDTATKDFINSYNLFR